MADIDLNPNKENQEKTEVSKSSEKKEIPEVQKKPRSYKRLIVILTVGLILISSFRGAYYFFGDQIASYLTNITPTKEEELPTSTPTTTTLDPEVTTIENESQDLEDSLLGLENPNFELEIPLLDISTDF